MTSKNKKIPQNNIYVQNNSIAMGKEKLASFLLNKLTTFLDDNEWIKVGYTEVINDFDKKKEMKGKPLAGYTPPGLWWSKGGWLFFDLCCKPTDKILYAQINSSNIYTITGKDKLSDPMTDKIYQEKILDFEKKYLFSKPENKWLPKGTHLYSCIGKNEKYCEKEINDETGKPTCKWSKKTQKCNIVNRNQCYKSKKNCHFVYDQPLYLWSNLINKYDGFAIYPYMNRDFMIKYQNHDTFTEYDVESLVLFNQKPIKTYHYLGTIQEIIDSVKSPKKTSKKISKTDNDNDNVNYIKLVNGIIKKIKELRKKS